MQRILFILITVFALGWSACTDKIIFVADESPDIPVLESYSAKYLWIGPEYKLAVDAVIQDKEALKSLQISVSEWNIDKSVTLSGKEFILQDTFLVTRDANRTQHEVDILVSNAAKGVLRVKIPVTDLSATNQIEGYSPDLLPPAITIQAPTINHFYGLADTPVPLNVAALITEDVEMTDIYFKVWGEDVKGQYFEVEDTWNPTTEEEKLSYHYAQNLEIPGGTAGEYQFMIRATDKSGNQAVTGGNLTVGMMDRLYLSDAKNDGEVSGQGFDAYASADAWGIGTLVPMQKIGNNLFQLNYYYRNDTDENIRFIAFMGTDRPFNQSPRGIKYTLDGTNVVALASGTQDGLTADLQAAEFRLPVSQKGYYTLTVDMSAKTVKATPLAATNPDFGNAALFPGFSASNPYPYLAIISGGAVVGTAGWAEIENNTSLHKETGHDFIYSGDFRTAGGVNISFQAPKASLAGNTGWFRLPAARANMRDTYGDLVSMIKPVGASGNGANYGISLTGNTDWHATYDLITYRLRIVKKQ
ncbi:hypothetical protein [uncultured Proteiniphilum sp.]|uniref:hypothetical protein n=1 Tax=uncultured Proteiniphilum sp. TaxID=497637 RepID=UPI002605AEC6|nr:hypothetical protein [uncultured Proteiniphilum sp.]